MKLNRILRPKNGLGAKKYVRIMKLTWFLILFLTLQTSASLWSQTTKMDVELKNTSLLELFSQIENNSQYRFFYSNDEEDVNQKVSVSAKDKAIGEILSEVFEELPYSFRELKNIMVLVENKNGTSSIGMQATISGKVTDSSGFPLPGVTVVIKGTTNGTITDSEGNYTIANIPNDAILSFSFVGMKTQDIAVDSRAVIDVQMEEDAIGIEEVVAIGYGTVKRRDLTGAVASVKSEEITIAPVSNAMEAIQGRVAGLDITRSSGKAGASSQILLRGNRSLTASSAPIYIIDGIQGSINNLNPNDIETMDILKDASSTAIYGSAGANGVIIITTKQAEKGKIQVDFDSYVSVNGWASFPSALQGDAWLNYLEEGYYATNGAHSVSQDELLSAWNIGSLSDYINQGKWIDWVDETLQTGVQQNYALSVRGGTDVVQSNFPLGYNKTNGIYKNDYSDRVTMRGKINIDANDNFKFGIQTGLIFTNSESRSSRINKAFGIVPLGDVYDEEGNINPYPIEGMTDVISLLANDIEGTYRNNSKTVAITANPYLELKLAEGLTFKSILGTSLSSRRQGEFKSDHTYMMLAGSEDEIRKAS